MRRSKGLGRVFKRGEKFYLRTRINGNEKVVSLGTEDEKEVPKKVADLSVVLQAKTKEEIAAHVAVARKIVKKASLQLDDVWKKYFESHSRPDSSVGTLGNYKRHWLNFKAWLALQYPQIKHFGQISVDIAQEYSEHIWNRKRSIGKKEAAKELKISANTFNYHIQSLSLITKILASSAGVEQNPWHSIKKKVENKQSRKDFTKDEVFKIFETINDEKFYLMNKVEMSLLCHIGAFTGLRLESAVCLKWSNIDFQREMISTLPAKTKRIQRWVFIPLHPLLRHKLEAALKWKDESDLVIPKTAARYANNADGVKKDIMKILDHTGLSKRGNAVRGICRNLYGFHSFRHFFASTCANAGVPVSTLSEILGDNIATLQKYYMHAQDESKKLVLRALPGIETQESFNSPADRNKIIRNITRKLKSINDEKLRKIHSFIESL